MTWLETLTSTPVLIAGALGISAALFVGRGGNSNNQKAQLPSAAQAKEQIKEVGKATQAEGIAGKMAQAGASVMSPPSATLAPPKNDPISSSDLSQYDGSDPSKPIYVAIKGKVFDVTPKREMYGPGAGYNIFAGKDASKGLGMSSLDPKDAIADYSTLNESQMRTLDQWESFFEKRYNIVGKVTQ